MQIALFLYKKVIFVHFLDSVIYLDSLRIIDLIPILIIHKMNIFIKCYIDNVFPSVNNISFFRVFHQSQDGVHFDFNPSLLFILEP